MVGFFSSNANTDIWIEKMKLIWTLMIWSCVTTQVSVGKPDPNAIQLGSTCINGYEKVTNSTMCARDSLTYIKGSSGVRRKDIARILELHNYHRARVVPTATNMMKMYWDDELAKIAEKWAKQCVVGHESSLEMSRYIPAYGMYPGQNGAFGYASWDGAVEGWYQEVNKYRYGQDPAKYLGPEGWREIGHYTQVGTWSSLCLQKESLQPVQDVMYTFVRHA
ncbi:venom allergen 5-like [Liolophura sinensis]|uniref:venom allergen 5-like n=1 Tax=Liolophura sinensis TaxID=3198878 RepID=UPI00315812D2